MDRDTILAGLKRLLPILSTVAALTPNKYDDAAVAFLRLVLGNPEEVDATLASLRKSGALPPA